MSPNLNRREFLGTLAAASALAIPAAPLVKEPWAGVFIIMQTPFFENLEVDDVKEAKDLLVPMTGGGARNFLNEIGRGSRGTMPGAGFADIQSQIWDWYQAGKKKQARDLFGKMLMMAVLEQSTGYVLQKEILRRRGIFTTLAMRDKKKEDMDAGDLHELDEIFEVLKPYFRV